VARREVQGVGVGFFQVEDGVAHRLSESSHVEGVPKWLKENHPLIHYVYVVANYTSKLQPADVVLQRPFKHGFRKQFEKWQSELVASQLAEGVKLEDVKL